MIDPVTGAVLIGGSMALNAAGAGLNYYQQSKNLAYQKWAQRRQWAREDTAVQRRVKDLEASGMSKVLASGQGASSSPPIQTHAPQLEASGFDPLKVVKGFLDITQTQAQADLTRAHATYQEALNAGGKAQTEIEATRQQIETAKAVAADHWKSMSLKDQQIQAQDYKLFMQRMGAYTDTSGWLQKEVGSVRAAFASAMDQTTRDVASGKITYKQALQILDAKEKEAKERRLKEMTTGVKG